MKQTLQEIDILPFCNTRQAIMEIGDHWTLLIIRTFLLGNKTYRFNELLKHLHPISSRTLSKKLKELEEKDLVNRNVNPKPPIQVSYEFTEKGLALEPVLKELGKWHKTYKSIQNA